ncbi:MAG: GNAT family N-acetyltransferase [Pseudomonadota bacterium]|nr:GNAT family N-acetyltransferase [Pseudomonadota bacterium]
MGQRQGHKGVVVDVTFVERAPSAQEYLDLRDAVGWHGFSEAVASRSLDRSLYTVCAEHGGRVVGCGRVVGDGGVYFYVQDILVHPAFQRQGLGGSIMERVRGYLDAACGPGAFIGLMSAPGLENFYARYGFEPFPADSPGMMIWK